jgi:hypothetical protein
MPAIWDNPFAYAHLKVDRADKHIADIQERLRTSPDSYPPRLHCDAKTGKQFLHYFLSDRMIRPDVALLIGDAIDPTSEGIATSGPFTVSTLTTNTTSCSQS